VVGENVIDFVDLPATGGEMDGGVAWQLQQMPAGCLSHLTTVCRTVVFIKS